MVNYYKEAINVLAVTRANPDKTVLLERTLLMVIAKSNPSVLVKASERAKITHTVDPRRELAIQLIEQSANKIQCIKNFRSETGEGLKETKTYIEKVQKEEGLDPVH